MTDKQHDNARDGRHAENRGAGRDEHPGTVNKRDVTKALEIARELRDNPDAFDKGKGEELISILDQLDARTGRRDPSKRATSGPAHAEQEHTAKAHEKAVQLRTFPRISPNWMSLLNDVIKILSDLNVLPSVQGGGASDAGGSPSGSTTSG